MNESGTVTETRVSTLTFGELYELYATDVLRVSYYYLADRQKAEDVTQEVFVQLIRTKPDLCEGHEKNWLLHVALNKCRDYWRSGWYKRIVLGHPAFELFPADDEISKLTEERSIAEAINRLSPNHKEIILLHYYQGYSVSEISSMLDIAEGTVVSRLHRAREKLASELGTEEIG